MSSENITPINWAEEATTPISSWADEMDELDALEPSSTTTSEDSQPSESSPSSSISSYDEDSSTTNDRSPQTESFGDRLPRSGSHNTLSSYQRSSKLRDSSDSTVPPKPSVKEQIPFPTVAPFVAFVSNVHLDASKDDVSNILEPLTGLPKSVKIILDKETGRPRGFCYVEFTDAAGLQAAIDADGTTLKELAIHIVVADQKKERPIRTSSHKRTDSRDQESNKGRHPRQDNVSYSSKGKFAGDRSDTSSYKTRKDDLKFQTPRSNSFTHDKRSYSKSSAPFNKSSNDFYREKSVRKDSTIQITTKVDGSRKVEERPKTFNNMFAALAIHEDR